MNIIDHARISGATLSYDLWLETAGVPGKRRRDLRRELRANLVDATTRVGSRAAFRGLGSTRALASAANPADPTRPRWTVGFVVGMGVFVLAILTEFLVMLGWLDGAMAATPDGRVVGGLTFFPGSSLIYNSSGSGFSVSIDFGWACVFVGLGAFILTARPWRLLKRRPAPKIG